MLAVLLVFATSAVLALPASAMESHPGHPACEFCECDGGIKIIEFQTSFAYGGGVVSVEARASKKDKLDSDPYGVDVESFSGSTFSTVTYSG